MQCERCNAFIKEREEKKLHGQILCEDCYMDLLSPVKACDPWAVHSAKTFIEQQGHEPQLNPIQKNILEVLSREGPMDAGTLRLRLKITLADMERELAALRHMEKVRGELKDGKRLIRLWG